VQEKRKKKKRQEEKLERRGGKGEGVLRTLPRREMGRGGRKVGKRAQGTAKKGRKKKEEVGLKSTVLFFSAKRGKRWGEKKKKKRKRRGAKRGERKGEKRREEKRFCWFPSAGAKEREKKEGFKGRIELLENKKERVRK